MRITGLIVFLTCILSAQDQVIRVQRRTGGGGGGAPTLINYVKVHGNATPATFESSAVDCTGANAAFIALYWYNDGDPTLTDSQSHTYSYNPPNGYIEAGWSGNKFRIAYTLNITGSATWTIKSETAIRYDSAIGMCFSNVKTSGALDQHTGTNFDSLTASWQPGSVTPTENGELLLFGVGATETGRMPGSISDSFTLIDYYDTDATPTFRGIGVAYKIQTTAAAINPTWTPTTDGRAAVAIATFKHN